MRKLLLAVLMTAATATLTNSAFAADTKAKDMKADNMNMIHVAELDQWMKADKANVFVFDANNEETRAKEGVIPEAAILPSSSHYDVATLPANKDSKVVFYCANTGCMASHDAAKVAMKAGYKNVYVMADGIEGWKKAGKPTKKFDKKA